MSKSKKTSTVAKATPKKKGRPARPGGLLDKVKFAKTLVKTQGRGAVVTALLRKFRGMSPLYAATVVQLARKEAGVSGYRKSVVSKTTKGTHIAKVQSTPKAPVEKKEPVEREDDDI